MTSHRLRWCLDVVGWSQNELARQLHVNQAVAHQWARAIRPIPDNVADWLEGLAAYRMANRLPANWKNDPQATRVLEAT